MQKVCGAVKAGWSMEAGTIVLLFSANPPPSPPYLSVATPGRAKRCPGPALPVHASFFVAAHAHWPISAYNNLFVAPDGRGDDRPFPQAYRRWGRVCGERDGHVAPDLWDSLKTSRRANHEGEEAPIAVQIAGTEAAMMADAARYNIDRGRRSSINMGCPAKKVCNKFGWLCA